MLLIELNSISNMGGQKIKVVRMSWKKVTWQTHHTFVKSLSSESFYLHKWKSFIPKKNMRHVSIQDFKKQKIVTRASARDYTVYVLLLLRPSCLWIIVGSEHQPKYQTLLYAILDVLITHCLPNCFGHISQGAGPLLSSLSCWRPNWGQARCLLPRTMGPNFY